MLAKRIIPCLNIKDGRTVKGINFVNLRDAGDPVELGQQYSEEGADELVFLDITATHEKRQTLAALAKSIAAHLNIPFTIGGDIRSVANVGALLEVGADKISVNSAAFRQPDLIDDLAKNFGSQCIVVAINAKELEEEWAVHLSGGRVATDKKLLGWAKEAESRGAGEIFFTFMNHDGTKQDFANKALRMLSENLSIPIIASGGAGKMEHFYNTFTDGKADATLAASIFHFREILIVDLKGDLKQEGIVARL